MARLKKLFEPEFKKSTPNPVRNRHEILAWAAEGFRVYNFFLPFPPGATQCGEAFCTRCLTGAWETPRGQPRAQKTSLAFLQEPQRAPYFLRFLPSESDLWHDTFLVITATPSSFKQQRNPWKTARHFWQALPLAFSHSQLFCYLRAFCTIPTSGWWSATNAQKQGKGRTPDFVAMKDPAYRSFSYWGELAISAFPSTAPASVNLGFYRGPFASTSQRAGQQQKAFFPPLRGHY